MTVIQKWQYLHKSTTYSSWKQFATIHTTKTKKVVHKK